MSKRLDMKALILNLISNSSKGGEFCRASGAANAPTALQYGYPRQVTLTQFREISDTTKFTIVNGGVRVEEAGLYKVTASTYLTVASSSSLYGTYVRKGSTWDSGTEVLGGWKSKVSGSLDLVPQMTSIAQFSAGDIVMLGARVNSAKGSVYAGNNSTFLILEKLA